MSAEFLLPFFGLAAIYVFYAAMGSGNLTPETAIMEMLIIVVLVMLGQTAVLIKIYEQTM